ncbi:MAG: helix-turn-helix domain-containing protein [Dehalococcoidia bacterium]|nr:helix-turn-helix domain-containing protein [Dehalococcoidia bacterium]
MEFSEKIKYEREKHSLSQEGLVRALNVSFAMINRWENSKTCLLLRRKPTVANSHRYTKQ